MTNPPTRAGTVRAWMAANPAPQTSAAIAKGTGLTPKQIACLMGAMTRAGHVTKTGKQYGASYTLARAPMTIAENNRARAAKRLGCTVDQLDRNARRQDYERLRSARRLADRQAARGIQPGAPVFRNGRRVRVECARVTPAKPATTPRETVAQWQARTGQAPEVLPVGQVSQPLKFIGFRAFNSTPSAAIAA